MSKMSSTVKAVFYMKNVIKLHFRLIVSAVINLSIMTTTKTAQILRLKESAADKYRSI